jgi:hypothetical protein
MVSPNLKEKFNKYGFTFNTATIHQEIFNGKKTITDIDVLLQDGDSVMAVEVKTKPTIDDVNRHIWRMEQIQQYQPGDTKNKRVYGAIAGAMVEEEVLEAAFNAGFYVVWQTGENIEIVSPPDTFVAKYWEAAANRRG